MNTLTILEAIGVGIAAICVFASVYLSRKTSRSFLSWLIRAPFLIFSVTLLVWAVGMLVPVFVAGVTALAILVLAVVSLVLLAA